MNNRSVILAGVRNFLMEIAPILISILTCFATFNTYARDFEQLQGKQKSMQKDTFYDSLFSIISKTNDPTFFDSLKNYIYEHEDIPSSKRMDLIFKSIERTQQLGLDYHYALFVYMKAVMATLAGNYSSAINMANNSLIYFLKNKKFGDASACYNTIGGIVGYKGDSVKGIKYLKKAIKYNELDKKDNLYTRRKIDHLIVYGTIHYRYENYDTAIILTKKALALAEKNRFVRQQSFCLNNIGSSLDKKKKYKQAKAYFRKALDVSSDTNLETLKATVYKHLSSISILKNEYDSAMFFLKKGINICENHSSFLPVHLSLLSTKSRLQDKMGNLEAAHDILKQYIVLKDSLFTIEKEKDRQWIEAEFDLQNNERDIKSLSQQSAIQTLEIRQKNQIIAIGLIVVLLVLSMLYLYYRQRIWKKEKSKNELEHRFLRSQLNPHFIANALSAVQHYILKNKTDLAARYLAKFSKLMREILENSRHEYILVKDELQMLTNFLDIHRLRMGDAFEYQIIVGKDISLDNDRIPPMFVQPFVENAIEHGIIKGSNNSKITLSFDKIQNYINIVIKDNGNGLRVTNSQTNHKSLSTTIILERMELFNHNLKHKIELWVGNYHNEQGEILGTSVDLKVPFSYA